MSIVIIDISMKYDPQANYEHIVGNLQFFYWMERMHQFVPSI